MRKMRKNTDTVGAFLQVKCIICALYSDTALWWACVRSGCLFCEMTVMIGDSFFPGPFFGTRLVFQVLLCEVQVWEPLCCGPAVSNAWRFPAGPCTSFLTLLAPPETLGNICQGPLRPRHLSFPDPRLHRVE